MKHVMALALAFALVVGALAASAQQGTTAGTATTTKKRAVAKTSTPSVAIQLNEMKLAIDAQQRQIQQLTQQVQSRDAQIQQLQQQVGQVQSDATDLKQNATNTALSLQETQKNVKDALESPLAIHYKGITITPGGFAAAETVWRSHALG